MEWKNNRRGRFHKLPADETELFLVPEKHLGLFLKVNTSDVEYDTASVVSISPKYKK